MLCVPVTTPQPAQPERFAHDKVQVLEDLEALIKLLSSRASDAEHTASSLQKQVTTCHAAADQSGKDQAACKLQLDILKKEAGAVKQVLTFVVSLCTKCLSRSVFEPLPALDQPLKGLQATACSNAPDKG